MTGAAPGECFEFFCHKCRSLCDNDTVVNDFKAAPVIRVSPRRAVARVVERADLEPVGSKMLKREPAESCLIQALAAIHRR